MPVVSRLINKALDNDVGKRVIAMVQRTECHAQSDGRGLKNQRNEPFTRPSRPR